MTIQQLITLSLRDTQVVWPGQTPSPDELQNGLDTLNETLDSWSNEGLLVPNHVLTQFALAAGTSNYTMGVGANWVTSALPIKLKGAIASLTGFQRGLEVLPMELFEASIDNAIGETSVLPLKLGIDNAAPQRNVRVWPTPNNSSAVIEASYWTPLASVALADTVNFALPGFQQAIQNELTLRLADMFRVAITPAMQMNAQNSKKALARLDPSEVTEPLPANAAPQPIR
jgi:hypothetical protein